MFRNIHLNYFFSGIYIEYSTINLVEDKNIDGIIYEYIFEICDKEGISYEITNEQLEMVQERLRGIFESI